MGKAGRPFGTLKYDNLQDLQAGIDAYFADCDANSKPYTMSGLADSLNITTVTLQRLLTIHSMSDSITLKGVVRMTIKEIRKAAGLTQAAMAELLHIPLRTIENWDTGNRTPPNYIVELIQYRLLGMLKK